MRILNLFNVPLSYIKDNLELIKSQGFDGVQISPIQPTKDDNSYEWWMLYQPTYFDIGNRLGSRKDLLDLCLEADKKELIIISDVVINHLAGCDDGSLKAHYKDDTDLVSNPNAWKEARNINDWNNRWEVTNLCMGLPGLNPNNPMVQDKVINMLNDMIDLGVRGFRFDAAKSIALPEEGCNFFPNVCSSLKIWLPIIYGEVIFYDRNYVDKYAKYMKVLTNYDASNKDSIVKFIENKDSYLSDGTMGYTKNIYIDNILNMYRDLCNNYPNTLFYARNSNDFDSWKSRDVHDSNKCKVLKRW